MSDAMVVLTDDVLEAVIDPGQGCDFVSIRHLRTGTEVLFSTPWREHADAVREGRAAQVSYDPVGGYIERYRGGWNTLFPSAGPPKTVHGAPLGFHGESVLATWQVLETAPRELRLRHTLVSVPVTIERQIRLEGGSIRITDDLVNTSTVDLEVDLVSHPAFGGAFLDGRCTVATNAGRFHVDPETEGGVGAAGSVHTWPIVSTADGSTDLTDVPASGESRMAFGWLSEFAGAPWAAIANHDLGFEVRIDWDATHQPYAWFWQELNWGTGYPWHRRARAFAIEPSSTPTSGPDRRSVLVLRAGTTTSIPVNLTLNDIKEK